MTLFLVSAIVAVVSGILNAYIVSTFALEYTRRAKLSADNGFPLPYGMSTSVVMAWMDQVADMASNFPAVVLTVIAFADIRPFSTGKVERPLLVLAASLLVLAIVLSGGPSRRTSRPVQIRFRKRVLVNLSRWTLLVVLLNIVGVVLILVFPDLNDAKNEKKDNETSSFSYLNSVR